MISFSTPLAVEVDFGMDDSHVTGKSICSRKGLFLAAVLTAHLLLLAVVDSILVTREIVGTAEDGVAGLAGRRIDTTAFVRTLL